MKRTENYEQLRLDFNRPSTKEELKEKLGCECANCGSTLDVEYHHIIPLAVGGTNRLTNIVPLCYVCHKIAHDSKNIRKVCRSDKSGRPKKKPPENYRDILKRYLYGEIGRKQCQNELGFTEGIKLTDVWYFQEYLEENKIERYVNKIDIFNCPKNIDGLHKDNRIIAEIYFIDGTYIRKREDGSILQYTQREKEQF